MVVFWDNFGSKNLYFRAEAAGISLQFLRLDVRIFLSESDQYFDGRFLSHIFRNFDHYYLYLLRDWLLAFCLLF